VDISVLALVVYLRAPTALSSLLPLLRNLDAIALMSNEGPTFRVQ